MKKYFFSLSRQIDEMSIENIRRIKEQAKLPKEKRVYRIPKKSAKKIKQDAEEKELRKVGGGNELDRWFNERRAQLTGQCSHCGGKTTKDSDQYFKHSIAHLLPKRLFKSIATHPENFLELCFWNNSCHQNFDNHTLDFMDLNCFDEAVRKFVAMYPDIAANEKKCIPDILLQYVNVEK